MRRRRRNLLLLVAGITAAILAVDPGADRSSAAQGPAPAGGALFQRYCAACHGTDGAGMAGSGVTAGPPIDEVDVAFVDLLLRTGRMPISERTVGIPEKRLTDAERQAVTRWMQETFDLPGAVPEVAAGDAGRGQEAFVANCSACHGADASGGVSGDGEIAPSLHGLDAVALTEAARVGPFAMPRISEAVLDDESLADIAAYVEHASTAPTTPLGLTETGHVTLGLFGFVLLVAGLVVVWVAVRAVEGRDPGATEDGPT